MGRRVTVCRKADALSEGVFGHVIDYSGPYFPILLDSSSTTLLKMQSLAADTIFSFSG
jgi:hypothetical protein